jgi:hypothetical protein
MKAAHKKHNKRHYYTYEPLGVTSTRHLLKRQLVDELKNGG